MADNLRIAIVGDFNPDFHSHLATNASGLIGVRAESPWLPTPSLLEGEVERDLASFDRISPGSPYRSLEGELRAIELARMRDWPFVAT